MDFLDGLIIGTILGGIVGIFAMALAMAAKEVHRNDKGGKE